MKKMQYVLACDTNGGGVFCLGIYDDYEKAVGKIMLDIWDFQESYKDKGDSFKYTEPKPMEGDGGMIITVTFKAVSWAKSKTEYYMILTHETEVKDD